MKTAAIITIIILFAATVSFAVSAYRAKKKAETGIYLTGYQRELTIGSLVTIEHEMMGYMKDKQEAGEELVDQVLEKIIADIRKIECQISGGPELLESVRKEWDAAEERYRAQEATQEPAEAPEDGAPLPDDVARGTRVRVRKHPELGVLTVYGKTDKGYIEVSINGDLNFFQPEQLMLAEVEE